MIELSRAEFDAWVKSEVGKMFSHGKIASIEFYYLIWKAGMAAGIERTAQAAGVNQLIIRLVGICEKQVVQVDKLLSIIEKK